MSMTLDMEINNTIPGTPSVKRQKTACGYNTTLSHTNSYDEMARIKPETSSPCKVQPNQEIGHPKKPLHGFSPTETFRQNHVQVPASSPLKAPKSPGRESSVDSIELVSDLRAQETPINLSKSQKSPVQSKARIDSAENSFHNKFHKSLDKRKVQGTVMASFDENVPSDLEESSDDDVYADPNIHPVSFDKSNSQTEVRRATNCGSSNSRFQTIIQSAVYKGFPSSNRTSSDPKYSSANLSISNSSSAKPKPGTLNGYENKNSRPFQTRMDRAQPIDDILLRDIPDKMKEKVNRLRSIFPSISILKAQETLNLTDGDFEQAANLLADRDIDLKSSKPKEKIVISLIDNDDSDCQELAMKPEPQMKRTLKAPMQSIRDRYSSTQVLQLKSSDTSQVKDPKKQRRRLVQGRKNLSSSEDAHDPLPTESLSPQEYESLSDMDSEPESVALDEDERLEARVLKYLNTCEVTDLVELANITKEIAEIMLAARPFESIDAARTVENVKKLKSGKKSARSYIGDKIVDTTMDMFRGYEAIDTLVKKCVDLSKPLVSEISQWGFDIYGAQKNGELEMTSLDDTESPDIGIGGPPQTSSNYVDVDEEVKATTKKRPADQFLKKPKLMAEDCQLKDYQVVGMNWLALMSRNDLSGILADEMGLGKTCQVISFLAHLVETGNTGPHLVICPGSTLENWLREIHKFAPKLTFEPYHGPQKDRQAIADEILLNKDKINIIVTTYDMAAKKEDSKFLRKLKPDVGLPHPCRGFYS